MGRLLIIGSTLWRRLVLILYWGCDRFPSVVSAGAGSTVRGWGGRSGRRGLGSAGDGESAEPVDGVEDELGPR